MKKPFASFVYAPYPRGSITQYFGENKALYAKNVCFMGRCMTGGHNGIDAVAPWGTPVYAVKSGKVVEVKHDAGGYGKHVRILTHDTPIGGEEWTYGHLSSISVKLGQWVQEGEEIGKMGNTGFVVSGATPYWKANPHAGTHVHLTKRIFSTEKVPNLHFSTGDSVHILNSDSPTWGAVDTHDDFVSLSWEHSAEIKDTEKEKLIRSYLLTLIGLYNQVIAKLRAGGE